MMIPTWKIAGGGGSAKLCQLAVNVLPGALEIGGVSIFEQIELQ